MALGHVEMIDTKMRSENNVNYNPYAIIIY